jgi:hypothetical protein
VVGVGEKRNEHKVLVRNLWYRDHFQDLSLDPKLILKWILKE